MKLRDYQIHIAKQGNEILDKHRILYLSMEVRTGKTLTALYIAYLHRAKRVLFVTKKKAIPSIKSDFIKIGHKYNIDIINFESLHKVTTEYDLIIIDEAHSIGAYPKPSIRTKILKKLIGSKPLILLSGTPTPESYSQIYHQLWVSSNSPFEEKTFYKWAKKYVFINQRMINGYRVNDYSKAREFLIKQKIKHLMISFSQEDAGFKSLVDEYKHIVAAPKELLSIFYTLKKDRVVTINDEIISASTPAILLQKLHQLSSGTILTDSGKRLIIDDFKVKYIKERFGDKHIAIFYKFIAESEMLKRVFNNIVETPEEFNQNPKSIFIGQFQSAREGVNLSSAEALVMISIDFSAVSYFQARARLQAKDRKTPACLYWIFSSNMMDEYIYDAVSQKHNFTLSYYKKSLKGL